MTDEPEDATVPAGPKGIVAAGWRALAEAEARRTACEERVNAMPREVGGRKGKSLAGTATGKSRG